MANETKPKTKTKVSTSGTRRRGRIPDPIEYVNTVEYPVWVDVFNVKGDELVGKCVNPGESVFFTEEELRINKMNGPNHFLDGRLRPADSEAGSAALIQVKNDMSLLEIQKYIEKVELIETFKSDLKEVTSLNTLNLMKQHVKNFNKTIDFYMAIEERIRTVETEKEASLA